MKKKKRKHNEKFADFLLDLAKIILASLVLGAVISHEALDKTTLVWLGISIIVVLSILGFLFQPQSNK